jgi:hypothetical protein
MQSDAETSCRKRNPMKQHGIDSVPKSNSSAKLFLLSWVRFSNPCSVWTATTFICNLDSISDRELSFPGMSLTSKSYFWARIQLSILLEVQEFFSKMLTSSLWFKYWTKRFPSNILISLWTVLITASNYRSLARRVHHSVRTRKLVTHSDIVLLSQTSSSTMACIRVFSVENKASFFPSKRVFDL